MWLCGSILQRRNRAYEPYGSSFTNEENLSSFCV